MWTMFSYSHSRQRRGEGPNNLEADSCSICLRAIALNIHKVKKHTAQCLGQKCTQYLFSWMGTLHKPHPSSVHVGRQVSVIRSNRILPVVVRVVSVSAASLETAWQSCGRLWSPQGRTWRSHAPQMLTPPPVRNWWTSQLEEKVTDNVRQIAFDIAKSQEGRMAVSVH